MNLFAEENEVFEEGENLFEDVLVENHPVRGESDVWEESVVAEEEKIYEGILQ